MIAEGASSPPEDAQVSELVSRLMPHLYANNDHAGEGCDRHGLIGCIARIIKQDNRRWLCSENGRFQSSVSLGAM